MQYPKVGLSSFPFKRSQPCFHPADWIHAKLVDFAFDLALEISRAERYPTDKLTTLSSLPRANRLEARNRLGLNLPSRRTSLIDPPTIIRTCSSSEAIVNVSFDDIRSGQPHMNSGLVHCGCRKHLHSHASTDTSTAAGIIDTISSERFDQLVSS